MWVWGQVNSDPYGQEQQIAGFENIPLQVGDETDWATVAAGQTLIAALKTDGSIWAWRADGRDVSYGVRYAFPLEGNDWAAVIPGAGEVLYALKINGSLWRMAGADNYSPELLSAGWSKLIGDANKITLLNKNGSLWTDIETKVNDDTDWTVASQGKNHALALKVDGSLWAWGMNNRGQLGDGTLDEKATPVQIGSENDWSQIAAGEDFSLALKTDGTLWAWGQNDIGQLGLGALDEYFGISTNIIPTQVGNDADWSAISVGGKHVSAVKSDGGVWSWGNGVLGQLGGGREMFRFELERILIG